MKNCDLGLENAALGLRPRAAFSRPWSQFFTIRTSQPANNIYYSLNTTVNRGRIFLAVVWIKVSGFILFLSLFLCNITRTLSVPQKRFSFSKGNRTKVELKLLLDKWIARRDPMLTCTSINQSINQSLHNFIYPRDHFTKKWSSKEPCTLTLRYIT